MFCPDPQAALALRQVLTKGRRWLRHRFGAAPERRGVIHKFGLRRCVKDKVLEAARFFGDTPTCVYQWPIEVDYDLGLPVETGISEWTFQSRTLSALQPSASSRFLEPCVVELYRWGKYRLRMVKSILGYEIAYAVSLSFDFWSSCKI